MAKSNGSVIGVWLDAMKSGLELWHEFTAHGRIKTMDEVRRIEYVYSMNMQSEIGRIRDAVQLIGHNDEIGFKMELSEAMEHPILGREMSEMIDKLVELQKKMRFYEPDLNVYFCGFEDNDNDVNALNLALMDLFTMMSVSLTNVVCWVNEMRNDGKVETGMEISGKKESAPQETRVINEDELKEYFKISFKGGGHGNIDYFTGYLLPYLKVNRSDKDFAKIALMIYYSGKLIDSMCPNTFKEWYGKFCELVGCGFHEEYKPNKLVIDESFKRKFSYL